jgi:hypothetical protein
MANKPVHASDQLLDAARRAIGNTLDDAEILSLVSAYGYTVARVNEGKALYESAKAAVKAQRAAVSTQREGMQGMVEAEKAARETYQTLAQVVRAIFAYDKSQLAVLGLTGPMPRDIGGFLAAAYTLFDNVHNIPSLADYGYTSDKLQKERAKIVAYNYANQWQQAARNESQQAARRQEEALKSLDAWMAKFMETARDALCGRRQMLEKLGMTMRMAKEKTPHPALTASPNGKKPRTTVGAKRT